MPIVSVVVIGYNDASHIETAVRSAMRQSERDVEIVVVDDGSTDETPAIVDRLARADARIRSVRMGMNSGGCGRPRNVGLEHATGEFVTFLDSDDVLPRRAVRALATAGRSSDADLVCGRLVRRHHRPTRYIASHPDLYTHPALLRGVAERPRQLFDTPACGKLYRRRFLDDNALRFPEDVLYEDLLFTTSCYLAADRIAVIPDLTYIWNVRRSGAVPSITNRRDLQNWRDRFEVHRRIDRVLEQRSAPERLRAAKNLKFLDVDLHLLLRELREASPDDRAHLLGMGRAYLDGLDLERTKDARPAGRLAAFLIARGDPRALAAADYATTGGLSGDIAGLDVVAADASAAGFARTPFLVTVTDAAMQGHGLTMTGLVHDVLGLLEGGEVHATLEVSGRVGGPIWRGPVDVRQTDTGLSFATVVDLAAVGRRVLRPTIGPELRFALALRRGETVNRRPLSARDADLPTEPLAWPTPWRRVVGDEVRLVEANGRLVLHLAALPRPVDTAIGLASAVRYGVTQLVSRHRRQAGPVG